MILIPFFPNFNLPAAAIPEELIFAGKNNRIGYRRKEVVKAVSSDQLLKKMAACDPDLAVLEKYDEWIGSTDCFQSEPFKKKLLKGGHTREEWEDLKRIYNYTCPCCGRSEPEITLTRDHIVPRSMRWDGVLNLDNIENIQPLCAGCNRKKGRKLIPAYPLPDSGNIPNVAMRR